MIKSFILGCLSFDIIFMVRKFCRAIKHDFRPYIIYDDIPPRMKILNMVIPIQIFFSSPEPKARR